MHRWFFSRSSIVLILALGAGLVAAWSAREHIQNRVDTLEAQARVPTVSRIVAAQSLAAGTRLEAEHLAVREFPAHLVPSRSLPPESFMALQGGVLREPVSSGDPILPIHAITAHTSAFSSQIAMGRRAITLPVDRINAVSGLLQPGDLIDLYVTFEYQRRMVTAPLLQGVLVLATDTRTRDDIVSGGHEDHTSYSTVTLDAAPEEAVKLVAARQSGTLTAVLRPALDTDASTRAARGDLASLLGISRSAPGPSARAPVIYGNTQPRSVPRLVPGAPVNSQPSGLFDVPVSSPLVSAWMQPGGVAGPVIDEDPSLPLSFVQEP